MSAAPQPAPKAVAPAEVKAVETKPAPTAQEVKAAAEKLAAEKAEQEKAVQKAHLDRHFLDAAKQGNLARLRNLVAEGADLKANDDGNTALFYTAQHGHMDAVLFLVEKGIPVDVKNRIGSTPLMGAAGSGHADIARALADLGSNPFLANYSGGASTAYSYAKGAGHKDLAEELYQRKTDVVSLKTEKDGKTLHEIFNFAHGDKFSFTTEANGPATGVHRETFTQLENKDMLKLAFQAYAEKGGKRPPTDFTLPAPVVEAEAPKKKSWLPWKR